MGNEELGECSRYMDDDIERPLKKAKYAWQVKGKYHLKNEEDSGTNPGNSFLCSNNCVDNLIARTEAYLDEMPLDDEESLRNFEGNLSRDIPVTLVSPNQHNQNYYLRKWQARKIAKSYLDNTINTVLDHWASSLDQFTPAEVEDFINSCDDENDGDVEDEGILMAIKSHGLQSTKKPKYESDDKYITENICTDTLQKMDNIKNHVIATKIGLKVNQEEICPPVVVQEENIQPELEVMYPMDILNAGILAAIERKGLSSVLN